MTNEIEKLAINSWKNAAINGHWSAVAWQFFGMHRLMLYANDAEAADLADFLSSLAIYRGEKQ